MLSVWLRSRKEQHQIQFCTAANARYMIWSIWNVFGVRFQKPHNLWFNNGQWGDSQSYRNQFNRMNRQCIRCARPCGFHNWTERKHVEIILCLLNFVWFGMGEKWLPAVNAVGSDAGELENGAKTSVGANTSPQICPQRRSSKKKRGEKRKEIQMQTWKRRVRTLYDGNASTILKL